MKVEILAATNLEPRYLDCVVPFIKFVLTLRSSLPAVDFVPRVILTADAIPSTLSNYAEFIDTYPTSLPSGFVAQNIRTLNASLSSTDIVITSDIDMMPLTAKAFDTGLRSLLDHPTAFVVLRNVLEPGQYPICYNLATPEVFREVTGAEDEKSISQHLQQILDRTVTQVGYDGQHGGAGWYSDQEHLFTAVEKFREQHPHRALLFNDNATGHRRLDRAGKRGRLRWFWLGFVFFGLYTDYHVHHPVPVYRHFINAIYRVSRRTTESCVPRTGS